LNEKKLKSSKLRNLNNFWVDYFEYNNASLKNFNTNLKFPKVSNLTNCFYIGKLLYSDKSFYRIKLLFNYSPKGKIINGWFVINGIDAVPLKGKIISKNGKLEKGTFSVVTNQNFHIFGNTDKIEITFKNKNAKGLIVTENTNLEVITPKGNHLNNPKIFIELRKEDEI
jgi:hypothetical protein